MVSTSTGIGTPERTNMRRPSVRAGDHLVSPTRKRASLRFDVSGTMDRLRSTFAGVDADESANDPSGEYTDDEAMRDKALEVKSHVVRFLGQIPAIILIGVFHLMIGIPFGVSYFPIEWGSSDVGNEETAFPIPGKIVLGIRMFLFSTIIGQVIFTFSSGFSNPIGLQMVENVPFCHALASIVIRHQGYGLEALSTLMIIFGFSSLLVGAVFIVLGKFQLGRIVYYFPTHVLVGCIGGIGLFIAKNGIEITTLQAFGIKSLAAHWDLLLPVVAFEVLLRFLERCNIDREGKPRLSLLTPIYFCLITPTFYALLWLLRIDPGQASDAGYFFPSILETADDNIADCSLMERVLNNDIFNIWKVIKLESISLPAVVDSIPTLIALTLFSLIHVPINIPAFALTTNVEADMNKELVAHGYSNLLSGAFGGLQNYMAYTQSVLYYKSGGDGIVSGVLVAIVTAALFVFCPLLTSFIPRCMAGTLLLHVGFDLFLEGVYDSLGKFDWLEYSGIWLITFVMTMYGMDAAMIAGAIAAVSTYAVQSVHYVSPIRGSMSAATLRSSRRNRPNNAQRILDSTEYGRSHIFVVQLQGHLFFGNIAQLMQSMTALLSDAIDPKVVILDFSLVLGIDSSAARAMIKLKGLLRRTNHVNLIVFVTGADDGFPTEFDLRTELTQRKDVHGDEEANEKMRLVQETEFSGSHVAVSLDEALIFAEDSILSQHGVPIEAATPAAPGANESEIAQMFLTRLIPGQPSAADVKLLFSRFKRQECQMFDTVWLQGDPSTCLKLLIAGELIAELENEAGTVETISTGNTIGEVGLVQGLPRMSSVKCISGEAVLYSLEKQDFDHLCDVEPKVARLIDLICIQYLSGRVQHVSNRIFETRCLPI